MIEKLSTKEWNQIQSRVHKLKVHWEKEYPVCIFCLQRVKQGAGQLCHKVPRSWNSKYFGIFELQTKKENTGLGHPICHTIYDDDKKLASVALPGFWVVMHQIKEFEPDYYNLILSKL